MIFEKKIKTSLVLGILVFITQSCSNDNDSGAESEISKASGIYELIELNVSPPQDVNEDGIASRNLLSEMGCISGILALRPDGTYILNLRGVEVTSITGGQFFINCGIARISESNWTIQNGMVTLFADVTTTPYNLVDDRFTRTVGEILPGIQSVVYVKQ